MGTGVGGPSGSGKLCRGGDDGESGDHPCQRDKFSPKSSVHRGVCILFCHKGLSEPISQKARVKMQGVLR